jgi:hypothetical protein
MELKLMRALFPNSTMGQLFMNNKLLCIYVGVNNNKGGTPVDRLPDGRYFLRKPGKNNEDWSLQVTSDTNRKPLYMNLSQLSMEKLPGYDEEAPIYLSWGAGQQQMTEMARKNVAGIITAIEKGEKVSLTICSQHLG